VVTQGLGEMGGTVRFWSEGLEPLDERLYSHRLTAHPRPSILTLDDVLGANMADHARVGRTDPERCRVSVPIARFQAHSGPESGVPQRYLSWPLEAPAPRKGNFQGPGDRKVPGPLRFSRGGRKDIQGTIRDQRGLQNHSAEFDSPVPCQMPRYFNGQNSGFVYRRCRFDSDSGLFIWTRPRHRSAL
jgi:hypothetical protein